MCNSFEKAGEAPAKEVTERLTKKMRAVWAVERECPISLPIAVIRRLAPDPIVALGNRGQYVVVIPSRRPVVVRRGFDGIAMKALSGWLELAES